MSQQVFFLSQKTAPQWQSLTEDLRNEPMISENVYTQGLKINDHDCSTPRDIIHYEKLNHCISKVRRLALSLGSSTWVWLYQVNQTLHLMLKLICVHFIVHLTPDEAVLMQPFFGQRPWMGQSPVKHRGTFVRLSVHPFVPSQAWNLPSKAWTLSSQPL